MHSGADFVGALVCNGPYVHILAICVLACELDGDPAGVFDCYRKFDFEQVEKLFDGEFVQQRRNVCFIGTQGTGKTHSLIALGRELCRKGHTVRFYTACELVNVLEEAKRDLLLTKVMNALLKPKLLIIDELGFVPFSDNGARLLFDVFASRYERGSTI